MFVYPEMFPYAAYFLTINYHCYVITYCVALIVHVTFYYGYP